MEINAKQNLYRNYWMIVIGLMLLPELIYLVINGFGISEPTSYSIGRTIGFHVGNALAYFTLVSLISGILFAFTYLYKRTWNKETFLKILTLCSFVYLLTTLYFTFVA